MNFVIFIQHKDHSYETYLDNLCHYVPWIKKGNAQPNTTHNWRWGFTEIERFAQKIPNSFFLRKIFFVNIDLFLEQSWIWQNYITTNFIGNCYIFSKHINFVWYLKLSITCYYCEKIQCPVSFRLIFRSRDFTITRSNSTVNGRMNCCFIASSVWKCLCIVFSSL